MTSKATNTQLFAKAREQFIQKCEKKYTDSRDKCQVKEFLDENGSPDDARKAAESLKDNANKKWSSKRIPEEWINNLMENIGTFKVVGDSVMEGAPESIGLVWMGVRLALSAIQSNYELYSTFKTGLTDISEIMIIIIHYDQLYDSPDSAKVSWKSSKVLDKLYNDIKSVYMAWLDFSLSIRLYLTGDKIATLKHSFQSIIGTSKKIFEDKLNAIAAFKKEILNASQAVFQDRSFQSSNAIRSIMSGIENAVKVIQSSQKKTQEWIEQTDANIQYVVKGMDELKATTKAKTPWELAVQTFEKHRDALKPKKDANERLRDAIDHRHPGTCQWIFEVPVYKDWQESKHSVLCLSGQEGSGKSTVLAAIVEHLHLGETYASVLLFLSCGSTRDDDATRVASTIDSICNTLLCHLYDFAFDFAHKKGENIQLLEACNNVFENPKERGKEKEKEKGKEKTRSMVTSATGSDRNVPDFVDTFSALVERVERNVTIALDEVERLSDKDQQQLALKLTKLVGQITKTSLRVIIGCRSGAEFLNQIPSRRNCTASLDVDKYNYNDMTAMLSDELKKIPDLIQSEIEEATIAICDKAGSRFSYASNIGIPFMREPFQRPLSRRLEVLPQGMTNVYNEALRKMGSNYADVLRTALTWTLLAPIDPKVEEIMDAYNKKYEQRGPEIEAMARALENATFVEAPMLEVEQLRYSCGPFLRVEQDEYSNSYIVSLKDFAQVWKFCVETASPESSDSFDHREICANCKSSLADTKSVAITEKQGHLHLALTCLRHLNNPVFQQKAIAKDAQSQRSQEKDKEETDCDMGGSKAPTDNAEYEDAEMTMTQGVGGTQAIEAEAEIIEEVDGRMGEAGNEQVNIHEQDDNPENDSEFDFDDSMDDEDRDNDSDTGEDDSDSDSGEDDKMGIYGVNTKESRYELHYWMYHLRRAEEHWTADDRAESETWTALFDELDYFSSANASFFHHWQKLQDGAPDAQGYKGPLEIAAAYGLVSWVQHLLKNGEYSNKPSASTHIEIALQAAASRPNNSAILKLLLEHNKNPWDTELYHAAFHTCLLNDPSFDTVKLWLDHGADPTKVDKDTGWIALHYFAARGVDVQVLDLLLNHAIDGVKPNIKAQSPENDLTPLHMLMWRQDVPKELLRAFLNRGADVNKDDFYSRRPLQMASVWGNLDTLQILLDHSISEIDDHDNDGNSALHQAAFGDHPKCMDLLARYGANVNLSNKCGRVPLHDSAWHGGKECVETLLKHGAQCNTVDKHDRTPLFFACLGKSSEVADLLLDKLLEKKVPVAKINRLTKRHRSVMRQAASHGFDIVIDKLIEAAKAEKDLESLAINVPDTRKGMTPLHRAAMYGQPKCVRLLLDAKADPFIRDKKGKTALVLAYEQWMLSDSCNAFEDIISLIINAAPDSAMADSELVAICAVNGSLRLLQQLNELGVDLTRQDRYGWTPQQLAHNFQRTEAEGFLKQQAAWVDMLPSKWVDNTRTSISGEGRIVTHTSGKRLCLSANKPVPAGLDTFYFEVICRSTTVTGRLISERELPIVAIGFCTIGASAIRFPGWPSLPNAPSAKSWGYHSDNGGLFFSEDYDKNKWPTEHGIPYKYGQVVGCGVDVEKGIIWFTRDGEKLGVQFENVSGRLFPVLGLKDAMELETNFSGPFKWKNEQTAENDEEWSQ